MMQHSLQMPAVPVFQFPRVKCTLETQDFLAVMYALCRIEVYDTIWLSGVELVSGMYLGSIALLTYILTMSRPKNPQELFNLRHAQARNAVERIFGVLKNRFKILVIPSNFPMKIQVRILPSLCRIHHFIRLHDRDEINDFPPGLVDPSPGVRNGRLADGPVTRQETRRANAVRDKVANEMWVDYQRELHEREHL